MVKICEQCGKEFITRKSGQRFCGLKCFKEYAKQHSIPSKAQQLAKALQYLHLSYDYRRDIMRIDNDEFIQIDFYLFEDKTYYHFYDQNQEEQIKKFRQSYPDTKLIIITDEILADLVFNIINIYGNNFNLFQPQNIYKYRYSY